MISESITPRTIVFQTKEYLRISIEQAAEISRGRFSYIHPDREKPITEGSLGTHYEEDYLMELIENNSHFENTRKDQNVQKEILPKENIHTPERSAYQQKIPAGTDTPIASFEKSGLCLVTDL